MMARRITGTKVPREGEKVISNKLMKKTMRGKKKEVMAMKKEVIKKNKIVKERNIKKKNQ